MSVNIKTLRIGSHISINGERVEVESLQGGDMVGYTTPDNDWFATESWRFEPISITPELLEEIGLVKEAPNIVKRVGDYFIYFYYLHDDLWRIGMYDDTYNYGNCIVRYLHEAEAFLGLHNIELIKE